MSIKAYTKDKKKFYEVFVKTKNKKGKQIAKRKRGITSMRKALNIEFEIKKELEVITDESVLWIWESWHNECIKRMKFNLKNSTIINYDSVLKKWIPPKLKDKKLKDISKSDIFELIFETIGDRVSKHHQKKILKMVKRIFELAIQEGIIAKNPTEGISVDAPRQEQNVLTAKEANIFLKTAKETNHRFYYIWAFALKTGMRSGELYALKWTDIDFEANIISITRQWTSKDGFTRPKNKESRVVPISPDLKELLDELWQKRTSETHFVLPQLREWTNGDQALVTRDFCKSLGITGIKFHDLRATFITNMLAQGVPLVTVMSIVGHRKMSTTDVYLRLAGVDVKGATSKLGYQLPKLQYGKVLQLKHHTKAE